MSFVHFIKNYANNYYLIIIINILDHVIASIDRYYIIVIVEIKNKLTNRYFDYYCVFENKNKESNIFILCDDNILQKD